jgi:Bacterial capsule synthesis protein PGA_cap
MQVRHLLQSKISLYGTAVVLGVILGVSFSSFSKSDSFVAEVITEDTLPQSRSSTTAVQVPSKQKPILFTGDIMLGRNVEKLGAKFGTEYFVSGMPKFSDLYSAIIVNFESAMANPHVPVPSMGMQFSVATTMLPVLTSLGVTHASLANNHGLDHGAAGYNNAYRQLQERGIQPFGRVVGVASTSVTYIPFDEEVIALVGFHTLFHEPTTEEIAATITQAEASSTIQIAYVHFGDEYILTHSAAQKRFVTALVEAGFDIIVGHHPHVTQDIQLVQGVPVFYSLGNFIFDQYFSKDVQEGYLLSLDITKTAYVFGIIPHKQCALSVPCPMATSTTESYLQALANRSDPTLATQIMAQNIEIQR